MPNDLHVIRGGTVVLPDRQVSPGLVVLAGERIEYAGAHCEDRIPARAEHVDATGLLVLPGLIDTHVHGTHGDDVMLAGAAGIRRISRRFLAYGTTGWLPSSIAARHSDLLRVVRDCVEATEAEPEGAELLGIHVEGPYINLKRKGAQPADGIRDPDLSEMDDLLAAGEGAIRLVTLAPELPGGIELIRFLVGRGVIASMGHSDATYEQALEGIEAGARHATHLFNAMPPIHHRSPGLITACLNEDRVVAEVIPDGVHLDPRIVRMALRAKPHGSVALITDAFSATGLPDGEHTLGPHTVRVDGPLCTLADGTIAGSILTMNRAVANAQAFAGVSLVHAVRMASLVPAAIANCADRKGSLQAGKDADVALLDSNFRCRSTWVRGRRWATDALV
jgi:N-acetylglucosamine-6-phosphate deacetylase